MVATNPRYIDPVDHPYVARDSAAGTETDASLATKDTVGVVVAAIMTLAPLAATAYFGL